MLAGRCRFTADCDPTHNGITNLNDFNLLSLSIVTGLLLLDASSAEIEIASTDQASVLVVLSACF